MNVIRCVITLFMAILLALCIAGWIWAGGLPEAKATGARAVLALCGMMAVGSTALVWRFRQPDAA